MPDRQDTIADLTPESDRPSEALGEMNEARFRAAPEEVRTTTDAALSRAFPEGQD